MKLSLALFSLLVVISQFTCSAQETYFGITGGYNVSYLNSSNNSTPSLEPRRAYGFGLVYSHGAFNNSPKIGYSIELGYTLKGTKIDHDTLDYKFHYLNTAGLIEFYPTEKLKISAGPELAYLLSARNRSNDTTKHSIIDTYNKRFELSGVVNASYSLTYFMDFGVRYNHSFTHVSKFDGILDRRNIYNRYLRLFILLKIAN